MALLEPNQIAVLRGLLPASEVIAEPREMAIVNTATFATRSQAQCLVRIGNLTELQVLMRHCHENRFRVAVFGQGKNWGFGSKVPVQDVEVLIDLGRLDEISHYDAQFGTVRCGPGVRFDTLAGYLRSHGNRHFLNVTGGDPGGSVVGNLLERGDGLGPYCERADFACGFQVMLADGSLVELGATDTAFTLHDLLRDGPGPGLQGLFLQSNLGIVTRITLWLAQVPQHFTMLHLQLGHQHTLAPVLDALKSLFQRRILSTPITFWNDYKQIAGTIPYPWQAQPIPPLSRATARRISNNYSPWVAFGGIYVDHAALAAAIADTVFETLDGKVNPRTALSVIDSRSVEDMRTREPGLAGTPQSQVKILEAWAQLPFLGHPSAQGVKSMYWRKRFPAPALAQPEQDGCGLLWNAFVLPFDGKLIEDALAELDALVLAHKFEPMVSFVVLNDRYVRVFQQLLYDRSVEAEDDRALACHQAVFELLESKGWVHSRLDILNMGAVSPSIQSIQQRLKSALDPHRILSPGKYGVE